MMKFANSMASALVAASLVASPLVAQAAPAERVSTDVTGEQLRGGFVIPLLALVAILVGIWIAVDNENEAVSP